jgi:predicted RND superfamily exporter protein
MAQLLQRWRYPYLTLVGTLTVFFGYQCLYQLKIEQDNRSMDADNAGQMLIEEELERLFPSQDSLLVAAHRQGGFLDEAGKKIVTRMAAEFVEVDGVTGVTSIADTGFSISSAIDGLLISEDRKTCGLQITLADFSDKGESLSTAIDEIRTVADRFAIDGVKTFVSGLSVQKDETGRLVRADQRFFAPLSFLVLGCVLLLITRRPSGLIIPLLVAAVTICWTLGILTLSGFTLNMITSLLQPVIMTLAIATTIHIYIEWLHGNKGGRFERIAAAVKNLWRPCLFASLTTAAGFLSLLASDTPAVRQFGLFAAIGVAIAYLLGITGLAVGLTFVKAPKTLAKSIPDHSAKRPPRGILERFLDRVWRLSVQRSRWIVVAMMVITVVSLFGISKVRSNTDLLNYIGSDSRLHQDTRFIDENLTGVNTIELLIQRSDGGPITSFEQIEMIGEFQDHLDQLDYVRHSTSVADGLSTAVVFGGNSSDSTEDEESLFDVTDFLSADQETARITLHCNAIGSALGAELVDKVRAAANEILGEEFKMREAGDFYRVISESNQIVRSQITSFAIAIVLILIAIGVVFRSLLLMLLAIIPNVIPLLMMAAIMGFAGIELSIGTAMIASVVIGVAVDDTIHYLAAFQKSYHGNCRETLRLTTRTTGYALTATTLALSIGFWVAIFGSFQPTVHFALLSGLTMWFALINDLLVLPACMNLVYRRKESRSNGAV